MSNVAGRLAVLVLEDEPEVRAALETDLSGFTETVLVEPAEDVDDAHEVLGELREAGAELAVVLADHRLPGRTGVDFLVELAGMPEYRHVRTVLVTGQAGHEDTIRAVNAAGLDHYIAKPWDPAELQHQVRHQLTEFVLRSGIDPIPHMRALEMDRALEAIRGRTER